MLNRVWKGPEPTLMTCRGGRAQGTPPPCMQEHPVATVPRGGPQPDWGVQGNGGMGRPRKVRRPRPGRVAATMSHAGAAPTAAPLPGTRWPGCAWSTEPRPPPPGDTRKVTAPWGWTPAPCGAWGAAAPHKTPTRPPQHTHTGAEGLQPRHQLLHWLPEGFQRRARLIHGEGLAVPAVRGGRARGVSVLRPLAGGRGWVRGARLLPDLRVLCLQLVDLQWWRGKEASAGSGDTPKGVPPAPHPPRAAAGAAHRSGCCSPSSAAAPWPRRRPELSSPPGTPAA